MPFEILNKPFYAVSFAFEPSFHMSTSKPPSFSVNSNKKRIKTKRAFTKKKKQTAIETEINRAYNDDLCSQIGIELE